MIDQYTLAYTAGYTDGDGCFHIRKQIRPSTGRPKYLCNFIISSTDSDVIEFFSKTFAGLRRLSNTQEKNEKFKPQYHFIGRGKKSLKITEQILPFLVEKRQEAEIFIKFINSNSIEEKDVLMTLLKYVKKNCNLIKCTDKKFLYDSIKPIFPVESDFAYLAGLIDAECSLGIFRYTNKNKPNFLYKILLQCGNTKLPLFKWVLERFGGQVHFVERRSKNPDHRDFLTWRLSSKSLAQLLPRVLPYLRHKKPVCEELIRFYETTIPLEGAPSRNSPKFKEFYAPVLEERDRIFHKVHLLNLKGIQSI